MPLTFDPRELLQPRGKPKPDPFVSIPEYQKLLSDITHGKVPPYQEGQLTFTEQQLKRLDMKDPYRTASSRLKAFIKSLGLTADYYVKKRESQTPGQFYVQIVHEPPLASSAPRPLQERAQAWKKRTKGLTRQA
jgi:hypothetical protein